MASRRFEGVFPAVLEFAGFGMPQRRAAARHGEQGGCQREGVWDQRESGRGRRRPALFPSRQEVEDEVGGLFAKSEKFRDLTIN